MICPDGLYERQPQAARLDALRVVITRYNIPTNDEVWESRRASEGWLEGRLKVFTAFCLPSVLKQVEPPDLWLLGFDGKTPEAVAPVLAAIREHPWIVPVWQGRGPSGRYEGLLGGSHREIAERLGSNRSHVVSVRLDSDDALNRRFIQYLADYSAAVAQKCPELADFWVSFPVGASYHAPKCTMRIYTNNPFLARVEAIEHFLSKPKQRSTAMSGGHTRVFERGRVFMAMTTEPMWIQNVHGGNILNRTHGKMLTFASADKILSRSGVTPRKKWSRRIRRRAAKWVHRLLGRNTRMSP
jgi:hypothetical protein